MAHWLDAQGTPVIPPSPLVPRRPVTRDGFPLTLWQYVEEDRDRVPDYAANSHRTAALHAALRSYPGDLSFLSTADPDSLSASLGLLATRPDLLAPDDVDRARREWQLLEPLVRSRTAFEAAFPGIELQPVHGDCPPANLFHGTAGDLYADFELLTLGPVEWDLATLGPELCAAYDQGAAEAGIRRLDERVLRFVDAVEVAARDHGAGHGAPASGTGGVPDTAGGGVAADAVRGRGGAMTGSGQSTARRSWSPATPSPPPSRANSPCSRPGSAPIPPRRPASSTPSSPRSAPPAPSGPATPSWPPCPPSRTPAPRAPRSWR